MSSDPRCPIEIDVNCGRLVEGKSSAVNFRLFNTSQDPEDAFVVEITLEGDMFRECFTARERISPGQQHILEHVKVHVPAETTKCVVYLRVVVEDANHCRFAFRSTFAEDVHAAGDGRSVVSYHITAANGSAVDASGVHIGDRAPAKAIAPEWRPVRLQADATAETLSRCELRDTDRKERLVIEARRSIAFGRDGGEADIQVVDLARRISRTHCRILFESGVAHLEHLSRTNTTRLDGAEVAGKVRLPDRDIVNLVLAGSVKLRLTPIASAIPVGTAPAVKLSGESGGRAELPGGPSAIGGYLIEAADPPNAVPRTLWLVGAVRAAEVLPGLSERSLVLGSAPHLVRGQLSESAGVTGTRPLRRQEQVAGWVVVGGAQNHC